MDADVAIVGAGAAGVAAVRRLAEAGCSTVLIEASDRVGGRAWTVEMAGMPLDLGCGWLHSADRNPLAALGEAAGFGIVRGPTAWREQWRGLGFPASDRKAAEEAWTRFRDRLEHDPPPSDRAADALEPGGPWNGHAEALSGYMNGASLGTLSVADFLNYEDAASDENWRVAEGYGTLIAASLAPTTLRLATPVHRIRHGGDVAELATPRGIVTARAAIVTVSTAMLAGGDLAFAPAIDDHRHAAACVPLGLADKLFLQIGGDHGFEPETHLIGNPRAACTGSYYIRPLGRPVIEAFFGGPGAEAIEREGQAGAFAFAIDELAALLGSGIRAHLRPLVGTAWARTDWVGGSYSHALPGHAASRSVLARPGGARLFFAGEATHPTDFSTAHGAWESGLRAADEVIAMLAKS